jgi:predicted PurR-regulated permease PerM
MSGPIKKRSLPEPDRRDAEPLPVDAHGRTVIRTIFAALLALLVLWVAWDFLTPLAWAAVIAITVWPAYVRFADALPGGAGGVLAPLVCTLLIGIVLLVPVVLVLQHIAQGGDAFVRWVTELKENGIPVPGWIVQAPVVGDSLARWWEENLANPAATLHWLRGIDLESFTASTRTLGGDVLHRLVMVFVSLLALFFVLRDGALIARRVLEAADRLLGDPGERLAGKMADAVRGTVNGTIVVAVAEGALIGVGYVLAGVPNALLFAVLTTAFAMVPFGAWAAFTLAALVLLLQGGSLLAAACVFGFGSAVMLIGDNFIWPALVGSAARLPFLLALVGIFGGLQAFGLIGLFVGPVIVAAALVVWREWIDPQRNPQ